MEAAAIEAMRASPQITASQSTADLDAVAAVDEDEPRPDRQPRTARASAHSDARRMLSRSMRDGGANATATSALAQMCS